MSKDKKLKVKKHNQPNLKESRKFLRKNLTPAEALLWRILKNKNLEGRKFSRQHSINNYIVDFYCASEKLIVELDGQHHFTPEGKYFDAIRDTELSEQGYIIIRIEKEQLFKNPAGVVFDIIRRFKNE